MTDTSAPPPADLAARIVEEWAMDRLTVPTPTERDLARWIVEKLAQEWDVEALFKFTNMEVDPRLAGPRDALESGTGPPK